MNAVRPSLIRLLLALLSLLALPAHSDEPLKFARNELLPEQDVAEYLFHAIFRRMGIAETVTPLPPARANLVNVSGQYDGEIARIPSYGEKNPSLIRVDPPYYSLTTVVFARRDRHLAIATRDELNTYSVGIINGVQHSIDATSGHPNIVVGQDSEQLFQLLELQRIDVVCTTGIDGKIMLRKLGLDSIAPVASLARRDLHIYLNPRHQALVPAVSAMLTQLHESGEMDRLIEQAEQALLDALPAKKTP